MKYLLDTNACIQVLRKPRGAVASRFFATSAVDMAISIVTKAELLVGPNRKAAHPDEAAKVKNIIDQLIILPFDHPCAEEFGRIAGALFDIGSPVDGIDIQIAATAKLNGLTIVTHNVRDFSKIQGLKLEDWEALTPT